MTTSRSLSFSLPALPCCPCLIPRHSDTMAEGLRRVSDTLSTSLIRERAAFSDHINGLLEEYEDLVATPGYLPLDASNLLEHLRDGVILAYLLHHLWAGSIDLQEIIRGVRIPGTAEQLRVQAASEHDEPLSPTSATVQKAVFLVTQNLNLVLDAAKACKLVIVNLGAGDIVGMNEDLVLGLLWQIIRGGLLRGVDLVVHPELVRLLKPEESLKDFMSGIKPETMLLRWFNFHLQRAQSSRTVSNWGRDLQDSECFLVLLDQLFRHKLHRSLGDDIGHALAKYPSDTLEDRLGRASTVIAFASQLGLGGEGSFVSPVDIAQGHPRLNLALTAALFNAHIGISLPSEEDLAALRRERDDLLAQVSQLKIRVAEASRVSVVEHGILQEEAARLRDQLSQQARLHQAELAKATSEFQIYKEELAAQYQDSLESRLASERRQNQEDLWKLAERQNSLFKLILTQTSLLHRHACKDPVLAGSDPLKAAIEAFKTLNLPQQRAEGQDAFEGIKMQSATVPPEDWLSINFELIEAMARRNRELTELSSTLHRTVAHKEHVNEVMGAKIREFTEEFIRNKAQDNTTGHTFARPDRGNSITRIFSFKK
jgi:hypothetical protein